MVDEAENMVIIHGMAVMAPMAVCTVPQVPMDSKKDAAEPPATLWQKLLPLALIFFCASFNLTILANLKDAIVSRASCFMHRVPAACRPELHTLRASFLKHSLLAPCISSISPILPDVIRAVKFPAYNMRTD